MSKIAKLRAENAQLSMRIIQFKQQQKGGQLRDELVKFTEESKKNLHEMNNKITQENTKQNQILHSLTAGYQNTLKAQIQLLTQNKALTEKKEAQDKIFNDTVEKITEEYEGQIKAFEAKVKANVKKITDLSGGNVINRLIKNERFRQAMQERGVSLDGLEKQSKLEQISAEVQERERDILQAEEKSAKLDEELGKMHELIDTMKSLLENMMKEKDNIIKQNTVLKEKLKQSEELIGRLLGGVAEEDQPEQEQKMDQDQDEQQGDQEQQAA